MHSVIYYHLTVEKSLEFMNLIIGDIIHLIGYYPNIRPTTTTQRPSFDSNNKPFYQYPYNQNDWNYESNHIQHGPVSSASYPSYQSPVSSSSSTSQNANKPQNSYNYNSNNNNYGGFLDDSGYGPITPSPIISGNDYNRPQATPQRPQSTNVYQQQDYPDDGYSYGSYQGIERFSKPNKAMHLIDARSTP